MRQFLLAASAAYPSALPLKAGEFAVTTLVDGVETISADGAAVKDTFYLNLKKASGDTVVLPAYKMHFSFEKSVYEYFGQTFRGKDSVRFYQSGDITIDGVEIQVKYLHARICYDTTLTKLKKGVI